LLGTGRIDLGMEMLSEGGVSSGPLIPWKEECPREQLKRCSMGEFYLAYRVFCLGEFLMRYDTCLDPHACQKLTTTRCPFASSFSKLQGESVEHTDLALAREVEASLVL